MEFIDKVDMMVRSQNLGFRACFPTEAQWEYACRAGTTGDYAGDLDSMAWCQDTISEASTYAVGMKSPNKWGFYDMHGNVREWCADAYDERYYHNESISIDPFCAQGQGYDRVVRGASWKYPAKDCTSSHRYGFSLPYRYHDLGLRLALVSHEYAIGSSVCGCKCPIAEGLIIKNCTEDIIVEEDKKLEIMGSCSGNMRICKKSMLICHGSCSGNVDIEHDGCFVCLGSMSGNITNHCGIVTIHGSFTGTRRDV